MQIAVITVVNAVHQIGSIIKMAVAKALADRCAGIEQGAMIVCKNQGRCLLLYGKILPAAVKNIFIVPDGDDSNRCPGVLFCGIYTYLQLFWNQQATLFPKFFFYIESRKKCEIRGFFFCHMQRLV